MAAILDLPGRLPDVDTYASGPLTLYYRSINGTPFPDMKAKLVSLSGQRKELLLSSPTATRTEMGVFLFAFDNVDETLLKLRLNSKQIEKYASEIGIGASIYIELVLDRTGEDEDDEPVGQQKITFKTDAQTFDGEPNEINLNVNGTRFEVIVPTGPTTTVATFSDLLDFQATLDNTAAIDLIVTADETDEDEPGRTNKYFLTATYYRRYAFV